MRIFASQMTTSAAQAVETDPQLTIMGNFLTYFPSFFWLLLVFVIGFGLWRRDKGILLVCLWWFGNLLIANPYWLSLPGAGAVTSFTILIAIYIPASLFMGAAAGWIIESKFIVLNILPKYSFAVFFGLVIFLTGVGVWGSRQRMRDVQPSKYSLVTRPDIQAAAWIRKNTIPEAHFLVNSFPAFNNSVIVGSDGGWWIPLLARRQTTLPPITYGFEHDPWPGYAEQVNALTFEIEAKGIQNPNILSQMKDRGISYLYIGQLQGQVNSGGALFTADQLLADENFKPIYHQDQVWIFQIQ
jgi:hypothetical protein